MSWPNIIPIILLHELNKQLYVFNLIKIRIKMKTFSFSSMLVENYICEKQGILELKVIYVLVSCHPYFHHHIMSILTS